MLSSNALKNLLLEFMLKILVIIVLVPINRYDEVELSYIASKSLCNILVATSS